MNNQLNASPAPCEIIVKIKFSSAANFYSISFDRVVALKSFVDTNIEL